MHKSRLSLTKPFSLRKSTNFSGRNILQRHKQFPLNADNKEGGENKLQDEMDVESDNDDNNGEDDNGNGEEENNEDDDDDNNEDDDDDNNEEDDDDDNNEDDDDGNNEDDDDDIYGGENVYYDDDGDNVDENEMEEDYDLGVDDSIIDDSSNVIFKFIHLLASMNEPPILDTAVFLIIEKVSTFHVI
ncbi:unnamed protein product [Rhizophagus irregularis]|nr:unnamed protein product [Rhizophagus irregularis]